MPKQQSLNLYLGKRGGRRPGCGRKRMHSPGVAHRERPEVGPKTPLHVNFKYRLNIRNKDFIRILKRAILYVLFNEQRHSGSKMVRMDEYCSLRFLSDVKGITRKMRMTLIWREPGPSFLDRGLSYGMRRLSSSQGLI